MKKILSILLFFIFVNIYPQNDNFYYSSFRYKSIYKIDDIQFIKFNIKTDTFYLIKKPYMIYKFSNTYTGATNISGYIRVGDKIKTYNMHINGVSKSNIEYTQKMYIYYMITSFDFYKISNMIDDNFYVKILSKIKVKSDKDDKYILKKILNNLDKCDNDSILFKKTTEMPEEYKAYFTDNTDSIIFIEFPTSDTGFKRIYNTSGIYTLSYDKKILLKDFQKYTDIYDIETVINRCYYISGDKNYLRDNNIIDRYDRIINNYDNYNCYDIRNLDKIILKSRRITILSKHPKDSYKVIKKFNFSDWAYYTYVLILDKDRFWSNTDKLVIGTNYGLIRPYFGGDYY